MKIFYLLLATALVSVLFTAGPGAARDRISATEQQLLRLQTALDSLNAQAEEIRVRSDSLSTLISNLKAKEKLGFFERRRLEKLLQESLHITARREKVMTARKELQQQLKQIRNELLSLYEGAVDSLLHELESRKNLSGQEKKVLAGKIRFYQNKSQRLTQGAVSAVGLSLREELKVEPTDTPIEIEAKADFYRDMGDKLKKQASLIEARIKKVRQEATLRKRLAQFIDDVQLFDSQDEPVATSGTSSYATAGSFDKMGPAENMTGFNARESVALSGSSVSGVLITTDRLLRYDLNRMSPDDMESYLFKLEKEKRKLLSTADSLKHVAASYDEQAQKLRDSLGRPIK